MLLRIFLFAALTLCAGDIPASADTATDTARAAVKFRLPRFEELPLGPNWQNAAGPFVGLPFDMNYDGRSEVVIGFGNFPPAPNRAEPLKVVQANPSTLVFRDRTNTLITAPRPKFVHPRTFAAGDFNADGKPDLFIGGHGYDQDPWRGERDRILLSNSGSTHDAILAPPEVKTFTHGAAAGDINGDGADDIYVGVMCCSAQGPYFIMGTPGGTPTASFDRLSDPIANREVQSMAAALVDVDGANGKDLVLTSGGADNVVFKNDGTGHFLSDTPDLLLPPGLFGETNTNSTEVQSVDVDTDGRQDLLISQTEFVTYEGGGIQLLRNTGTAFVDQTTQRLLNGSGYNEAGAWKLQIYLADFYGDGITDFMVGSSDNVPGDYVVWLNDGSGRFTPKTVSLFEDNEFCCGLIFPVDADADRRTDVLGLIPWSPTELGLMTFHNIGPATTGPTTVPSIVRQPKPVTVDAGEPLLLSVSARGTRPLKFRWFRNGSPIAGERLPIFRRLAAAAHHAGNYRVEITNLAGEVTSATVTVVVQ